MGKKFQATPGLWVNGWSSGRDGWALELIQRDGLRWRTSQVPPGWIVKNRAFEPSLKTFEKVPSEYVPFEVENLATLSKLISPGDLVGDLIPPARSTSHVVFVVEPVQGLERVYLPAVLLIQKLWCWSQRLATALLEPNALDTYVPRSLKRNGVWECPANRSLVTSRSSDEARRRIAWLSQCGDARASFGSVLSHAYQGSLGLVLPSASVRGWAWGIRAGNGLLACELCSIHVDFDLPRPEAIVRIGP